MKTALILLSILGMACAFSMKNFHRRIKAGDSEENGVFKYRPRYFLYKHAYFYPPLKRFPVQGSSDSSEENGDGDSSEEEGEEEETSNEEENNEESEGNEDQEEAEAEAENATLSGVTASYGAETTAEAASFDLAGLQLPKKAGEAESRAPKTKESDEEEEEGEEEEENENEEAEVDENEQVVNGTSTNSTEVYGGNGSSGGDNGEEAEEASVTAAGAGGTTAGRRLTTVGTKTKVLPNGFQQTTPPPEAYGTTSPSIRKSSTVEYWGEYEQTGNEYNNKEYEIYDNENGEPRGDTYRAYEDEYSYYKGHGYEGYEGQDYYYHQ